MKHSACQSEKRVRCNISANGIDASVIASRKRMSPGNRMSSHVTRGGAAAVKGPFLPIF